MHRYLTYGAFGWLAFTGTAHFLIDVVSQHLRGKRQPSVETTLYYGLNSAFALSQVLFGLICLWIASRQPGLLSERPVVALCFAAAAAWLALSFAFMGYWEPRVNAAVFAALLTAAVLTAPGGSS